ncbi:MAG: hypothetical protein WDN26_10225 [Chitinophagaceae bacterium]
MQKQLLLLLFCCLIGIKKAGAQSNTSASNGTNNLASFDMHLPVAIFARSHFAGAGLNYSWSHHRFGNNVSPSKFLGFILNAGANYYFAKKISSAGYDFRYGGYFYPYIMPGIIVNPSATGNITLNTGPAMEIYKGNSNFGFGVNLFGSYFLTENISFGPGITYKKHEETDALWALAFRISYSF